MERKYTIDDLKELSPDLLDELFKILSSMRSVVKDPQSQQISIWNAKEHKCPYCDSTHFIKNGHRKNGAQKFFCKDCNRSFSMDTNTVGYGSHFNIEKWTKFIECELNGFSHRKTAQIVGIHRNTALLWRHKFYNALDYLQNNSLNGQIQLDAKNIPINFKGMKKNRMPRNPKKRGSNGSDGKNNHTACIISGTDDEDHLVLKVQGFGKETTDMYRSLSSQIKEGSLLIGDGFQGFKTLAKELKCRLQTIKSNLHVNENGYSINTINQIHSELEIFLKKYHGVSTRNLQGYLNMFVLKKKLRYTFDYLYHTREAWNAGVPHNTEITRRNESSRLYPFDVNLAFQ